MISALQQAHNYWIYMVPTFSVGFPTPFQTANTSTPLFEKNAINRIGQIPKYSTKAKSSRLMWLHGHHFAFYQIIFSLLIFLLKRLKCYKVYDSKQSKGTSKSYYSGLTAYLTVLILGEFESTKKLKVIKSINCQRTVSSIDSHLPYNRTNKLKLQKASIENCWSVKNVN